MKFLWLTLLLPALCLRAADASTFTVGDFTFAKPAKWESVQPSSAMRKAQLRVPAAKGDGADVIFFHFGAGDGGGTQANIDRWFMQFKDAKNKKSDERKIGKRKVIFVSTEGTYSGGMPGQAAQALDNYALRGAIIESSNGNIFIKMTGPAALVKDSEGDFRKMIEGALK